MLSKSDDGNHYIAEGTWVRDTGLFSEKLGVVASISESRVNIKWYPRSSQYISVRMFRAYLRTGRFVLDDGQMEVVRNTSTEGSK